MTSTRPKDTVEMPQAAVNDAFKWWEYKETTKDGKEKGKKWTKFSDADQAALNKNQIFNKRSFVLRTFDIRITWKSAGYVKSIPNNETTVSDAFIVSTGIETQKGSNKTFNIRQIAIITDDGKGGGATKASERSGKTLRKRFTASVLTEKGTNILNVIAKWMGKKRSEHDIRVWIKLRETSLSKRSPMRRLQLLETNELLKYFGPLEMARLEQTCRLFYFLGSKDDNWNRLSHWRKMNPRTKKAQNVYWWKSQSGKAFFEREFVAKRREDANAAQAEFLDRRYAVRKFALDPLSEMGGKECLDTIGNMDGDFGVNASVCGFTGMGCLAFGIFLLFPLIYLIGFRADKHDHVVSFNSTTNVTTVQDILSDEVWTPYLVPTYFLLAGVFMGTLSCAAGSCRPREEGSYRYRSNLRTESCGNFFVTLVLTWTFRAAAFSSLVTMVWFAVNLARIADGSGGAPETWKDTFFPLWIMMGSCATYATLAGLVFNAIPHALQYILDGTGFLDQGHFVNVFEASPFDRFASSSSEKKTVTGLLSYAFVSVWCLFAFSYLLPSKLDDDDEYDWNTVFAPIWVMYGVNVLLNGLILSQIFNEDDYVWYQFAHNIVSLIPVIFFILLHVKLATDYDISWLEVMVPWLILGGLIFCGAAIGFFNVLAD